MIRRSYPPADRRDWLTEPETAAMIGIGTSTLRRRRRVDALRRAAGLESDEAPVFYKVGKTIRYLRVEVQLWIARHSSR